jgi:hypothetical protein
MDNVETREKRAGEVLKGNLWTQCIAPRTPENREACIAGAAYLSAKRRSFAPGHELDDWLAAESEVDQRLAGEGHAY